ncbi:hypothetical protein GGX14DRAFT_547061 [Mycena pura]|uniref:Six-hairpin glycosidase-like protein n=1 Tax=Mycena pura TaxID=153505 RepID=A0AAD6UL01_9AGAR|nr:hypothetical protein GGX14DRAFT_547061 [Mycena pura]
MAVGVVKQSLLEQEHDTVDVEVRYIVIFPKAGSLLTLPNAGSANAMGNSSNARQGFVIKLRPTEERSTSSEPPFGLNSSAVDYNVPHRWRHMKHACGVNPDSSYLVDQPESTRGLAWTVWSILKVYDEARKIKTAQDQYCTKALAGDWTGLGEFPSELASEALVDVLRGQVKVQDSSDALALVDLDAFVRMSNGFQFPIASFNHAHESYLFPEVLKQKPPASAIFTSSARYKREAYRHSEFAARILADNELKVVMKIEVFGGPVIGKRPGMDLRVSDRRPIMLLLFSLLVSLAVVAGARVTLAPKKFDTIPLGQIHPAGWLANQLRVQTEGLAGHEHEFYRWVKDTDWVGGSAAYSYLEEAGSYWFNAMVPNGVLVDAPPINAKTREFLDYVLDTQDESGWLGPEVGTDKRRVLWGRYPFMLGAIQMTEVYPEVTSRVVNALHRFVVLANKMLKAGNGTEMWAATRWEDFVIVLQWLYDNHPNGQEALLLDTMKESKWSGIPWELVFSEKFFPKVEAEKLKNPFPELSWHGVNMAEGLKALPATYRFTHNQSDLDVASKGWDMLFKYHGRPSGAFAADEYLAGLEAARGTELCLVVEAMFSGSYLYQVTADLKFADQVERMAYNALPAMLTGDMWARQYLQQQNQIASKNMTPNPFPEDGPYSNVFGLEPNYPCCTVNFPQGWPKFITNAFLVTPDKQSLVHLYLGPFSTSVVLAPDNAVTASVETLYPFGDVLTTTISSTKPFTYLVRIPSWVTGGTISVNGGPVKAVAPAETGLHAVVVRAGTTTVVLNLPSEIRIESRPHGSVALHRGPLNYAFDIPRTEKQLAAHPLEPRAVDMQFMPAGAWQYAIDPATLAFNNKPPASGVLPSPIYDAGLPPVTIKVSACPIDWPVAGDTFAAPPPENAACLGRFRNITLWPFGAAKLRISEFPVAKLPELAFVAQEPKSIQKKIHRRRGPDSCPGPARRVGMC